MDPQTSKVRFHQHHTPAITPGEYRVEVTGSIQHSQQVLENALPKVTERFAVLGARFTISPQLIDNVFPFAGSTGEYSTVLPHVCFTGKTFPWQRSGLTAASSNPTPWLVLLMFDEEEVSLFTKKIITLSELSGSAAHYPAFTPGLGENADDQLTVIDVAKSKLQEVLPSTANLRLLAHTREGTDDSGNTLGSETSVVLCNRLPAKGKRSTMHLVSVEGRYDENGFIFPPTAATIRLVSLYSWEFYSTDHFKITRTSLNKLQQDMQSAAAADVITAEKYARLETLIGVEFAGSDELFLNTIKDKLNQPTISAALTTALIENFRFSKTFDGLLLNLNKEQLGLRLPTSANPAAELRFAQGAVPLEHQFRNGSRSVSWYRGPLIPMCNPAETPPPVSYVRIRFPQTSDQLLRYDKTIGMFDVSLSAAWELGRLLALADKDFSEALYRWKHLLKRHNVRQEQHETNAHLPKLTQHNDAQKANAIWEQHLKPWFEKIISLESIPANYLIADEQLLPQESIRFFSVDRNWIHAALFGAFSIAGLWDSEQQQNNAQLAALFSEAESTVFGFVLRSDVVQGWPGLIVDGITFRNSHDLNEPQYPDRNHQFVSHRKIQLSRDIALYLFDQPVQRIVFHLQTEIMHSGFQESNGNLVKFNRDASGQSTAQFITLSGVIDTRRIVSMTGLSALLATNDNAGKFAMHLIDAVPRVIVETDFDLQSSASS